MRNLLILILLISGCNPPSNSEEIIEEAVDIQKKIEFELEEVWHQKRIFNKSTFDMDYPKCDDNDRYFRTTDYSDVLLNVDYPHHYSIDTLIIDFSQQPIGLNIKGAIFNLKEINALTYPPKKHPRVVNYIKLVNHQNKKLIFQKSDLERSFNYQIKYYNSNLNDETLQNMIWDNGITVNTCPETLSVNDILVKTEGDISNIKRTTKTLEFSNELNNSQIGDTIRINVELYKILAKKIISE